MLVDFFGKSARLAACLTIAPLTAAALEPFPPAAVDEWIIALKGGHASLPAITTERMVLALSQSERLAEACSFIHGEDAVSPDIREKIGDALMMLDASGHEEEAAKVDAAMVAASPRLRWTPDTLDAALRLFRARKGDELVRVAETLMLVPECDRTQEYGIDQERGLYVRSITFPEVGQVSIPRGPILLPLLKEMGALGKFRRLAEERVAAVPGDLTSLRALTLAMLLETGDDPELWKRLAAADRHRRWHGFLPGAMEFCHQHRIPAPHLCEVAMEICAEQMQIRNYEYRHFFPLILSALQKDLGKIEEARKYLGLAVDSLSGAPWEDSRRFLDAHSGTIVLAMDDKPFLPEVGRWTEFFAEASRHPDAGRGKFYRLALTACEWALAYDLPEAVTTEWFRLAGTISEEQRKNTPADHFPDTEALLWHHGLLLSAGMFGPAGELLDALELLLEGKETNSLGYEAFQRRRLAASFRGRKPFVIPDAKGGIIRAGNWAAGFESGVGAAPGVSIADVMPVGKPGDERLAGADGAGIDAGGNELDFNTPPRIEGPNLIPSDWRWNRGSSPGHVMAPWESKDGSVRMGFRGWYCGQKFELWSGIIPFEQGRDYLLSGRIGALGGAGVTLHFLDADGTTLSKHLITEQESQVSPGERWFRVNLLAESGKRNGLQTPAQAAAVRLVLPSHLRVRNRWDDLFLGKLAEAK